MTRLSNLGVRPNLLPSQYQEEIPNISVFELRDIRRRSPNLHFTIPEAAQAEWRRSLLWGDDPLPEANVRWAEPLACGMAEAVRDFEERPTLEVAFELLIVARQLYHTRSEERGQAEAAEWDERVCSVLLFRDEFRHTPEMIEERIESIVGHALPGPPRAGIAPLAVAPVSDAAPACSQSTLAGTIAHAAPVLVDNAAKPACGPEIVVPLNQPESPLPQSSDAALLVGQVPSEAPTLSDPDLARLLDRWESLPDHVRKCVMMLIDAADAARVSPPE